MQAAAVRFLVVLALLGATHGGAWLLGRQHQAGTHARQQLDHALAYADEILRRQGVADGLAAELEAARTARHAADRTITREVIRYVQIPPDRRCILDGAWRLLHDAAATGAPADSARLADGSAAPIADAAALETVAGNYEHCRDALDQLNGWQQWWRAVQTSERAGG